MTWMRMVLCAVGCLFIGCSYDFSVLDPDGGHNNNDSTVNTADGGDGNCGNGVIDLGEDCDGANLGGETCVSQGDESNWVAGELRCLNDCSFEFVDCAQTCSSTSGGSLHSCPASSVSDNFNDGVQGVIWGDSYTYGGATMEEITANGVLQLSSDTAGSESYVAYLTQDTYDLRTYSITVELVSQSSVGGSPAYALEVVADNDTERSAGVFQLDTEVTLFYCVDDTNCFELVSTSSPASNPIRYWRLRSMDGTFFADTSFDGVVWMDLGSIDNPFPMDHVHLSITAGSWNSDSPWGVSLDNFNILPDP